MPNNVATGTYTITSVRYNNILSLDDGNDGTPVAADFDQGKDNSKWIVTDKGNGRYTIQNKGQKTYAAVGNRQPVGATVLGRPNAQQFVIAETSNTNKFTIATTDTGVFFGLPDGETGSAVELRASPTDKGNWFTFTAV